MCLDLFLDFEIYSNLILNPLNHERNQDQTDPVRRHETMAPITISTQGQSTIPRRAERAVVSVQVASDGESQEAVSKDVTTTSNHLRALLKDMALKTQSGKAAPDAAITHWTMTSLSTGSAVPVDDKGNKLTRQFNATTRFEIKFQDFTQLGSFATTLSTMPHVSINKVDWRLTDATKDSLASRSRQDALRDAISKAKDYAEVVDKTDVKVDNISDGYMNVAYSSQRHQARRARTAGGHGHGHGGFHGGPASMDTEGELSFEPEGVELTSNVTVKFIAE